jgi:mono/diheme cytochrome c family protein
MSVKSHWMLVGTCVLLLLPVAASAQMRASGRIAGVVEDTWVAMLPDVTSGVADAGDTLFVIPTQASQVSQVGTVETVARGEVWFYQRCALCHLDRIVKDDTTAPVGPKLNGVLKDASPARETAVRERIQRGTLRMPGFRYGFTAEQFEELMAYLETL